jgi:uncharacterized protein YfkK (UPF0435 family)
LFSEVTPENNQKFETDSKKILRVVSDQMFEDLMIKFSMIFSGSANVLKFRNNKIEELTLIFEEICKKSDYFSLKGLPKYEPQILVSSREMNQYERQICSGKFEKIMLGYYSFLIVSRKFDENNSESLEKSEEDIFKTSKNNIFDFSSNDFFKALSSNSLQDDIFEESQNKTTKWNEINRFFPERNMKIYGPKADSPFFSFLQELILMPICLKQELYFLKYDSNFDEMIKKCQNFRLDNIYIEDTQDAKLSSDKILNDYESFFILPIHIYQNLIRKNGDIFLAHNFDGVEPNPSNIKNLKYRFSWPIYIYVDKEALKTNDLVKKFISEITAKINSGPGGVLEEYGLISK